MRKNYLFLGLSLLLISFELYSQNIPNGNFEAWEMRKEILQPVSWFANDYPDMIPVTQESPGYNSNYACRLNTIIINQNYYYSGTISQRFAYLEKPVSIGGVYKCLPEPGDSIEIDVITQLFNSGNMIAYAHSTKYHKTITDYIPFSLNFYYLQDIYPDTATVIFELTSKNHAVNSAVVVDNIQFDENTGMNKVNDSFIAGNIYPVPANEYINIPVTATKPGKIDINVYDLTGNKIITFNKSIDGKGDITIPVAGLNSGLYFISIDIPGKERIFRKYTVSH
jgi:hypothetical protein